MNTILDALMLMKNDVSVNNPTYGICANLSKIYNPTRDPKKMDLVYKFMKDVIVDIYGVYLEYPIEHSYTEYYMNKNKWDESTQYGKTRIFILGNIINLIQKQKYKQKYNYAQ